MFELLRYFLNQLRKKIIFFAISNNAMVVCLFSKKVVVYDATPRMVDYLLYLLDEQTPHTDTLMVAVDDLTQLEIRRIDQESEFV